MTYTVVAMVSASPLHPLYVAAAVIIATYAIFLVNKMKKYWKIPSVDCGNDPFTSWKAAARFRQESKGILQRGYDQHKGGMFKVALPDRWIVIVTGRQLINELWSTTDATLNFHKAVEELTKSRFSFGEAVTDNTYHVGVIRSRLTKNISTLFPELLDEISTAFNDVFPPSKDWIAYCPVTRVQQIVCRGSNRLFVGLPKCREPSFVDLNISYTMEVMYARKSLSSYPKFMQGIVGRYITNIAARTREAVDQLKPIIEERLGILEGSEGDYAQLPNDLLTWLIMDTDKKGRTVLELCQRVLVVNFGAIHTTTNTFMHLLLHLAANPDYVDVLRMEIRGAVEIDGWTKAAFSKMPKLDSMLRECLRIDGVNLWSLIRVAMTDYTFSNGITVPKGALIAAPTFALHTDGATVPKHGEQPLDVFDPWRFANQVQSATIPSHSTSTGWDYLPFGHGKMSCPGRFFAGSEIKLMVAYLVENYDVKLEQPGPKPPNVYVGHTCSPNLQAHVLFRKRC